MDWLFVRVNLKKAILFNFLCCQKFKQIWESGALVLWRSIAWLLCILVGFFFLILFSNCLTDVAFLHLSIVNDQSFKMFDGYHMQTSSSLDKT